MAYIACKPVRFDKDYVVGEKIPDHVIFPGRIAAIVGMGLIKPVEGAQDAQESGSVNGQVEPENGVEGAQDAQDEVSEGVVTEKKARGKKKGE